VQGTPVLEFLTDISKFTKGTKTFKKLEQVFGKHQGAAVRQVEHMLGGKKAELKYKVEGDLRDFNGLLATQGLDDAGIAQLYKKWENLGSKPLKGPDGLLTASVRKGGDKTLQYTQGELQAILKGSELIEGWAGWMKELGLEIPSQTAKFKKTIEAIPKKTNTALKVYARKLSGEFRPLVEKLERSTGKLGRKLKSMDKTDAVALTARLMKDGRRELSALAGKNKQVSFGNTSEFVQALRRVDDKTLAKFLPDPLDRKKFREITAEMDLLNAAVKDAVPELRRAADAMGPQAPTLSKALNNLDKQNVGAVAEQVLETGGDTFQAQLKGQIGSLTKSADDAADAIAKTPLYLPHIATEEANKFFATLKQGERGKRVAKTDIAQNIVRKFREPLDDGLPGRALTTEEVNKLVALEPGQLSEGVAQKFVANLRAQSPERARELDRLVANGTIKNMEDATKHGFQDLVAEYFETDVRAVLDTVGRRFVEAASNAEYFKNYSKLFGKAVNLTTKNGKKVRSSQLPSEALDEVPPGWVEALPNDKNLKGVFFPPEVAEQILNVREKLFQPAVMNQFLKSFDTVQNAWKISATAYNPAFHGRNSISNKFLNWLSGMDNPIGFTRSYAKGLNLQLAATSLKKARTAEEVAAATARLRKMNFKIGGGDVDGKEMLDIIIRNRGMDSGSFFAEEFGSATNKQFAKKTLTSKAARAFSKVKEKVGKTNDAARKASSFVEDNDRIAHIIYRMEVDKWDEATAGQSAVATLFDYGDLTDIESGVFRRLFPFYTWTRKSLPAMIKAVSLTPGKVNAMRRALVEPKTAINLRDFGVDFGAIEEPLPDELVPNFVSDNFGVPVRLDDDGNPEYFLLESWIPIFELNKLTLNPKVMAKEMVGMLSPIFKLPWELFFNKSIFKDQDIERFAGEKGQFLNFRVQKKQIHSLQTIRTLNELDNFIRLSPGTDEFRKREIMDVAMRFAFGVKLNKVDIDRRKATVDFQKKKSLGTLRSALKRAQKIGDDANAEVLQGLIREIEPAFSAEQFQLDNAQKELKRIDKARGKDKGTRVSKDGFTLQAMQDLLKSQGA